MKKDLNKKSKHKFKSKKNTVASSDNEIEALNKPKYPKNKNKNKFYYSFLTIVLLICVIQIGCSSIINFSKVISYQAKISKMKESKKQAEERNTALRQEVENFSKTSSLEAIARNNLKMAGEDEVILIINKGETEPLPLPKGNKHDKKKRK